MSFLDGLNQDAVRLGNVKPVKGEKCIVCGRPPATSGVEYCTPCGRDYAISIGAKVERVQPQVQRSKKERKARAITGLPHNARRRLTPTEVNDIREYVKAGGKQKDMAEKYKVSAPHISNIVSGKAR